MAQTSTQSSGGDVRNVAVGRFLDTGTVAATKITTGFKPRYVKIMNVDGLCYEEWYEGMAAASGVKTVDSGAAATDVFKITSNGITVAADGFTIGADTDILVSSEQLSWLAIG